MIVRVLVTVCWLARFAPAQEPVCKPVEGDRILGSNLAEAIPAFRALPPEIILGVTPPPGAKRTLHAAELSSLAQRYSIQLDAPEDVCFEWPMEALDRGRVLEALRQSLQDAGARIEIAETSLYKVPHGRLEFPRETLGKPSSPLAKDPVLWRGSVIYGDDHRFNLWVKVWIKVACQRNVALEAIKAGQTVGPQQFRLETGDCFPAPETAMGAPASPAGLVALRTIAPGSEIRPELVAPPNDVSRGDAVHVEVRSGAARLAFTARAESSGRSGDWINLRNPSSNRIFRARIQGKGQVIVEPESSGSNQSTSNNQ